MTLQAFWLFVWWVFFSPELNIKVCVSLNISEEEVPNLGNKIFSTETEKKKSVVTA